MRTLIKLSLSLVLLGALALIALAWLVLDNAPLVTGQAALSHEDIASARAILKDNDPRKLRAGARRTIELNTQEINLAANYLLQRFAGGQAQLVLAADRLDFKAALRVPGPPGRNYLNIYGSIASRDSVPQISTLRLGGLEIPGAVATWLVRHALTRLPEAGRLASAADLIEDLSLSPDRVRLTYQWSPALIAQARDTLLTGSDREALRFYHAQLVDLQARGVATDGSLTDLLEPMFAMALARSQTRDPVAENISLLTVLGAWASGQDISKLLPEGASRLRSFRLKIAGRKDFAQHFLTSAALAARGDSTLSDAVGLYKEISDTDRGSGFSFTDIAADRAGTRFGEFATRSQDDARAVQHRVAAGVAESDIMPPAKDFPEHMRAEAFRQRFGQVGSPAYRQVMAEIERRIDACGLYRR